MLVSNRGDSTVSVFDAASLALQGVVPVAPAPGQIAILPDASKAFITSSAKDEISVIDLKNLASCSQIFPWAALQMT